MATMFSHDTNTPAANRLRAAGAAAHRRTPALRERIRAAVSV